MDFSKSYLDALKSTGNPSSRRPPSFPAPPHSLHISSLPQSRPPSFPAPPQSSHISSLPESRPPSFSAPPQSSHISSLPESRLPNIPPDLITEILSRIPIKSLQRFRCVCKAWRDSILNPLSSLSFQNRKLAIRYGEGLYDLQFRYGKDLYYNSVKVSKGELCYPMRKKEIPGAEEVEMARFEILGSCKCFWLIKHDVNLYLWNPAIRQFTKVLSLPQPDYKVEYERRLTGSGLCYDPSTDDYKAVLSYEGYKTYEGFIVVASLKNRRWTSCCLPYKLKSGAVVVNELLHWVVKTRYEDGTRSPTQQIVCFDTVVDKFLEFSTPHFYWGTNILGLGVLDGCLSAALFGYFDHCYKVLVMKKYGVEESWTSLFTMSSYPFWGLSRHKRCQRYKYGCLVPLCFTKNGKVVFVVNGDEMVLYDPVKDSWESVTSLTNVFAYEESLVSPYSYGGGNDWRIERADAWNLSPHPHGPSW